MTKKSKKHTIYSTISNIIFITIGAILYSVALETFLIPNNIIDGGVVGISIISSHITKLPLGLFTFVLNIPFFIIGYKQLGGKFTMFSLFSVICLSIGVSKFGSIPSFTNDVLLAAIFGGIIMGIGVGLIIRQGGSLDGTEIVAIILDKTISFSIGEIVMFFNIFILGGAGFVFGWDRAMYSLIAYYIAFKVIDVVVEGIDESKAAVIISDKYEELAEAIISGMGRGITLLDGKGGYNGVETSVIYVVISRLEISKLKSIVNELDDDALITIGTVEVSGKKYKKKAIH